MWGPEPGQGTGCRCDLCREANRAEHSRVDRLRLYGQWQPYVDAVPIREHLEALGRAGIGWKRVALLSGVSTSSVSGILYGRPGRPPTRGVRRETAAAILAVRPGAEAVAPAALVDAAGTRRRLQALVAIGWSKSRLAARLDMLPGNFGQAMQREQVTAATARAVRDLYDELWATPPAEGTRREKASAVRARKYATEHGFVPPLAWDDDELDLPAAQPAPGWQRKFRRTRRSADTAEDAVWLRGQGFTYQQIAERLGISPDAIHAALRREGQQANQHRTEEETTMPNSVPQIRDAGRDGELPAPGTPHPDPRLAARGWQACDHGIWTRHPEREREPEREAG